MSFAVAFSPDGKTIAAGYETAQPSQRRGAAGTWPDPPPAATPPRERRALSTASPSAPTARPSRQHTTRWQRRGVVLWDVAGCKPPSDEPLPVKEGAVD